MANNTTMTAREQRRVLKNHPAPVSYRVATGYEDALELPTFATWGDQTHATHLPFTLTTRDRHGTAVTSARRYRLTVDSGLVITITTGTVITGTSGTDSVLVVDSDASGVIGGTVGHDSSTATNALFEIEPVGELGPLPVVCACVRKRVTIT